MQGEFMFNVSVRTRRLFWTDLRSFALCCLSPPFPVIEAFLFILNWVMGP
uniref:Uncharacterized protein n=1 Tax=Lepeophtheirus salmonis TaxID=72036 RepID=A0A0K2VJU4_LEPSM